MVESSLGLKKEPKLIAWALGWAESAIHMDLEPVNGDGDKNFFELFGSNFELFGFLIFFFLKIYLFMRDTERERGRDTGRGRSRLHSGSPTWNLIPDPQDHALG